MATFIIAEAGVNHNGDESNALRLVEIAAECGADAVKFQTFVAERLSSRTASKAEYQKRQTGEGTQFEMLKRLELSEELHHKLALRSAELGIEFMSTAFDEESLDFLTELKIKRIKMPSGEITNWPFLRHAAAKKLPMILSTGMSTLEEVGEAIDQVRQTEPEAALSVLHCTSNYPTAFSDVNLRAIRTLADTFGLPVGYSDHTSGTIIAVAAVAAGATIIEKHFTLDKAMPGPDHAASLEPHELKHMIQGIRDVEASLGTGQKAPTASEIPVRDVVRRSIVAAKDIEQGASISRSDLVLLRPGTGIAPRDLDRVVGRRSRRALSSGDVIDWSDIQ